MAHIDALVDKVTDPALRTALREQVATLLDKRSFGLVFQEHRPETVELPQHRVRRGGKVRVRDETDQVLYRVEKISGDQAVLASLTEPPIRRTLPRSVLVVVREFGDPVYPGLVSTGRVNRGGDKPAHVVINAENFHALETLLYTHEGKIDAIYIDPPYNTRERDWKYNNDYVDSDDVYRHSKWLAMMQRRLRLARRLLNPKNAVLIVTIDEKEYLRLGLLLEQTFPEARIQMVTSVISSQASVRDGAFSRCDEYLFFVFLGGAQLKRSEDDMLNEGLSATKSQLWFQFVRTGKDNQREDRKGMFYPIFADPKTGRITAIGDPIAPDVSKEDVAVPSGSIAIWPETADGRDGRWRTGPEVARRRAAQGVLRLGRTSKRASGWSAMSVNGGTEARIASGEVVVDGRGPDGAAKLREVSGNELRSPKTMWNKVSHNAGWHGSKLLSQLLPGREFPYPKSLYAVEDAIRFVVGDNTDAVILDFFSGSGTTAHAVARLNREDGGRRQCLLVTNNEVSDQEARALADQGYRPGDREWEAQGICEYVTIPRIEAALTGTTHLGAPVEGEYAFSDCFPFSEGLAENAEFFNLTYEDPDLISLGKKFKAIAPLLWLKAGGCGAILETVVEPWAMKADARYAVLFDPDQWREFVSNVANRPDLRHIFVVTDSESTFQQVIGELPRHLGCTQLYEDYLHNFQINTRERR